jgi:uncharacterized membrane protein (DUF485 family)
VSDPSPQDFTPESASPTDIAPLGRGGTKPPHERTAAEEAGAVPWGAIAEDPAFKELLIAKAKFVVPMTVFFVIYYFMLPVLVGWFPEMMAREVWGSVNWAYLFALSQFFMAWIVAFFYVAAATGWDKRVSEILGRFGRL